MKAPRIIPRPNGKTPGSPLRYLLTWSIIGANGRAKRQERWFQTQKEAEEALRKLKTQVAAHGVQHAVTTPEEQSALIRWREFKAKHADAPSLPAIIEAAIEAHTSTSESLTVSEAIGMRLTSAERFKRGERHLRDLRLRLARFGASFGTRQITGITTDDIERWLDGLNVAPVTWVNYAKAIGSIFTAAEKRITLPRNPMKRMERRKITPETPEILTPAEGRALLASADPRILPVMVLNMFCGVRREEARNLTWADLKLDVSEPYVEIGSRVAKIRSRRNPPIPENAVAWFRTCRGLPGARIFSLSNSTHDKLQRQAAKKAGFEWKSNFMRKSYSTYRLSVTKSAAQTSEDAGNSVPMLRRYYTNVTSSEDAREWFTIRPEGEVGAGKVLVMQSA
jgi:integrase